MSAQQFDGDDLSKQFEQNATEQHKTLMTLKQQREELDQVIERSIENLNEALQKNNALKDDIQTCTIHTLKEEEVLNKEKEDLAIAREETKDIKEKIKQKKQIQMNNLKLYEDKMASVAEQLRSGPKIYDQKNITAEISNLHMETIAISKELATVEEQLNGLRKKYAVLFDESLDICGEGGFNLSTLQQVISMMTEDKKLRNSEDQRLYEELKNLTKMSNILKGDLKELKQK